MYGKILYVRVGQPKLMSVRRDVRVRVWDMARERVAAGGASPEPSAMAYRCVMMISSSISSFSSSSSGGCLAASAATAGSSAMAFRRRACGNKTLVSQENVIFKVQQQMSWNC